MTNIYNVIDKRYAYLRAANGTPIRNKAQMPPNKSLNCKTIDPEWQSRINSDKWWASGYKGPAVGGEQEMEIIKRLLTFGGNEVVIAGVEEDAEKILNRGQLWYGDKLQMMEGEPSQCHENTANLWLSNRNEFECAIATGYALTRDDGFWRQHSWMMLRTHRGVKVIETTERRIAYFGFVLDKNEAEAFCEHNFAYVY